MVKPNKTAKVGMVTSKGYAKIQSPGTASGNPLANSKASRTIQIGLLEPKQDSV
jgi:hypothetical protein